MKKTLYVLALTGLFVVGYSIGETLPAKPVVDTIKPVIDDISANWFSIGAQIGYVVALKGGTQADLQLVIAAQKTNGVLVVSNWFATH